MSALRMYAMWDLPIGDLKKSLFHISSWVSNVVTFWISRVFVMWAVLPFCSAFFVWSRSGHAVQHKAAVWELHSQVVLCVCLLFTCHLSSSINHLYINMVISNGRSKLGVIFSQFSCVINGFLGSLSFPFHTWQLPQCGVRLRQYGYFANTCCVFVTTE